MVVPLCFLNIQPVVYFIRHFMRGRETEINPGVLNKVLYGEAEPGGSKRYPLIYQY